MKVTYYNHRVVSCRMALWVLSRFRHILYEHPCPKIKHWGVKSIIIMMMIQRTWISRSWIRCSIYSFACISPYSNKKLHTDFLSSSAVWFSNKIWTHNMMYMRSRPILLRSYTNSNVRIFSDNPIKVAKKCVKILHSLKPIFDCHKTFKLFIK